MGRTPAAAPGPLPIFRKIGLYGKTKKSTHGHQTTRPFRTHFGPRGLAGAAGRCESNATAGAPPRRPGRPPGALEAATYPGATDLPYTGLPYTDLPTPAYPIPRPAYPVAILPKSGVIGMRGKVAYGWIRDCLGTDPDRPTLYLATDLP